MTCKLQEKEWQEHECEIKGLCNQIRKARKCSQCEHHEKCARTYRQKKATDPIQETIQPSNGWCCAMIGLKRAQKGHHAGTSDTEQYARHIMNRARIHENHHDRVPVLQWILFTQKRDQLKVHTSKGFRGGMQSARTGQCGEGREGPCIL